MKCSECGGAGLIGGARCFACGGSGDEAAPDMRHSFAPTARGQHCHLCLKEPGHPDHSPWTGPRRGSAT